MIYDDLATEFAVNDWRWAINGSFEIPGPDDIKRVVESSKEALKDAEIGSTVTIGRLVIIKETDTYDVYIYRGEVK